jgi:hypothetical protein
LLTSQVFVTQLFGGQRATMTEVLASLALSGVIVMTTVVRIGFPT